MNKRFIGLDVGEKRIGVAISDTDGLMSVPVETFDRKTINEDLRYISVLIKKYNANGIVVGLPISLNGGCGPQMKAVQSFIQKLSKFVNINVETWDERLTTVSADKMMREAATRKSKRKEMRDALAASYILQGFLDRLRTSEID